MALTINQIGPCFAGEVAGIDLTKALSSEDAASIHAGMDDYAVLVFRQQPMDNDQHLAFSRSLGELEHAIGTSLRASKDNRFPTNFADVSNLDKENRPFEREDRRRLFAIGNRLWHSDSSFKETPAKYSLLHAHSIPSKGGNTEFADMRAAYDALDDQMKAKLEGLQCHHSIAHSRMTLGFEFSKDELEKLKGAVHPLVRTLPRSGRNSLYLASHASTIIGWQLQDARVMLRDLMEHATHPQFVHAHQWRDGDLVIWDNRATMHRATPFDDARHRRELRRVTTLDMAEFPAIAAAE